MSDTAVQDDVATDEAVEEQDPISASKKDQSAEARSEVKTKALIEKLFRSKDDLKDVKNALKAYKVTSEPLEELKKARKELTDQINEEKERIEKEFQKDSTYMKLREQKLDAEEKIAIAKQDLKVALKEEAKDKELLEIEFEMNGVPMKLQTQMKVALFFNGREEK